MNKILLGFFFLFLSFCTPASQKIQNENGTLIYPVFENCDKNLSNEEKWKCMSEKLNILYHYQLTHEYGAAISNQEDSIILRMKIDTIGAISIDQIKHSDSVFSTKTDSVLYEITKKVPLFSPAVKAEKKIDFYFKMPIILTK